MDDEHCVVVLLKEGHLQAIACRRRDVFRVAGDHGAGICGVFEGPGTAGEFIQNLLEQQVSPGYVRGARDGNDSATDGDWDFHC